MAPGLLLLSRLLLAGVVAAAASFAAVGHAGVDISCESPAAMEGIEQFLGPHVASGALPGVDPAKLAESAALLCAAFVELRHPEAEWVGTLASLPLEAVGTIIDVQAQRAASHSRPAVTIKELRAFEGEGDERWEPVASADGGDGSPSEVREETVYADDDSPPLLFRVRAHRPIPRGSSS